MIRLALKVIKIGVSELIKNDLLKEIFAELGDYGIDIGDKLFKEYYTQIEQLSVDKIDILFVSHFDDDHVNGISKLCEKCEINCVVLPDLYEHKILYLTEAISNENSMDVMQLIIDPNDFFASRNNRDTKIAYIVPYEERRDRLEEEELLISSGENLLDDWFFVTNKPKWKYLLHNSGDASYLNMIKSEVMTMLKNSYGQSDIDYQWIIKNMERLKKPLKDVYKRYGKAKNGDKSRSNLNSLVVYSGPVDMCDSHIEYGYTYKYLKDYDKPGFLYCGDYNMYDSVLYDEMSNSLGDFSEDCGGIQLPHHGSKYNYNSGLINTQCFGVVSVGNTGRHRGKFPNEEVATDVLRKSELCVVTEQNWTAFEQELELRY